MFQSKSHILLTHERTAFAFASVPDAVYETLAIATVVHKRERRLDNISRLMKEVKFICPGIKRCNKARIGPRGYSSGGLAPP